MKSPACWKLFFYALEPVTPQDIAAYCPNDPGYPAYVREFTSIRKARTPPSACNFEISETINLTQWGNPQEERDPDRFRRFRIFTNSVAAMLWACGDGPDESTTANYVCINLLDDAYSLQDAELMRLLFPVLGEMIQPVSESLWGSAEVPFLLLGQLLIALMGYAPHADISGICDQLMEREARCSDKEGNDFLWGCTSFDSLHHRWKHLVNIAFPTKPDDATASLLRDALLHSSSSAEKQ
jgi:hypothetical protein